MWRIAGVSGEAVFRFRFQAAEVAAASEFQRAPGGVAVAVSVLSDY